MKSSIKILFFLTFVFLTSTTLFAQTELFKVIAVRGKALTTIKNSAIWNKIYFGEKLKSDAVLKLGKDVYVGLVHTSGKTIELKKEGVYDVMELAQNIKPKNSESVTFKFFGFILNEVSKSSMNKKNMDVGGAVYRTGESDIKLFMPRNTNIMDSLITFTWFKADKLDKYYFRISDKFSRNIYETELSDTALTLNPKSINLIEDSIYYWTVSRNKNYQGTDSWISMLPKQKAAAIEDSIKIILSENDFEETTPTKFIIAQYLVQNHVYDKSLELLKEINNSEPGVEEYKNAYVSLLKNLNLEK